MATVMEETAVRRYQMLVGGRWTEAKSGETYEIVDPATDRVVAVVPKGGVADADEAVSAAREAFDKGPWPRMTAVERAEVLRAAAALVRERAEELAILETRQMGKLLEDSLVDMNDAAHTFDYYAGLAVEMHGQTLQVPGDSMSMVVREPVGVTVGITPWNFPILMAAWKAAPALAAGNVMIIKPASVSPLTTLELARIFEEAGLPAGVLQVVTGPGGSVGDRLATSADVDMVAFTGSVEVGKHIMKVGSDTVKRVGLELGGKSPNIVFADADFEAAIDGALVGIFAGAGQVCSAGSRLLVERPIYDRFVGELVSRAMAIKVGPGLDGESEMGPLVSKDQLEKVESYVRIGLDEGAKTRHRRPPPRRGRLVLRADHLRRRRQSHAHRPGGDLRAGARRDPVRHRGAGGRDRQRHDLRPRGSGVDQGRHAGDEGDQRPARRHHLGQHLPPDLQRGPVGRLQAERRRPRARHLRAR